MKETKNEFNKSYHEDLIWMSYRYAICRHTIAAHQHALNIAKYEYDNFTKDERKHFATDIRQCIEENLRFGEYNVSIDYSILQDDRRPLEFLLQYFIDNPNWYIEDNYKGLIISQDPSTGEIVYKQKKSDTYNCKPFSTMYLEDLLVWMDLASYFDEDNYKICKMEYNGEIKEITYFDSYILYSDENNYIPHWKKVKKPVKQYIDYLGTDCYIPDDAKIIEE